jgi:diaminopimelate decarboxylase
VIGGVDTQNLVAEYGTPLYVFDEETLLSVASDFQHAFSSRYANTRVVYACKAFTNVGLITLLSKMDLGFDAVSGGEIAAIEAAQADMGSVYFHGNNKSEAEIERAISSGVGRIVIDNQHEIDLLERVLERLQARQAAMIRISPGVDPHTHAHTTTGVLDSKFGLPVATGAAEAVVARLVKSERIDLTGLHFHLGSPIFELEPYREAIDIALDFAREMCDRHGFVLREISPGGGFAVNYLMEDEAPGPEAYAEVICGALEEGCRTRGIELPTMTIEPGRAIVGRAGVALYTVGAIKHVPSIRTFVAVDGGMGDNIRPAIYGSRYEAVIANRFVEPSTATVTIAGKYCESGDILVRDCDLPVPEAGDIVAVPASGAYCLAMASNYNSNPTPAVVLVHEGKSRLLRRRQTYEDLMTADVMQVEPSSA